MNTAEMNPTDALETARDLSEFLESAVGAFFIAGDGGWPTPQGWAGMLTLTVLLNDLLKRAADPA